MSRAQHTIRSGFSLVELALVITIISVVVAVGMNMGSDAVTFSNRIATQQQMKIIKIAVENYYVRNGALPCPANRALQPGIDAAFGQANCTHTGTTASAGIVSIVTGTPNETLIGMVPIRSLGLPDYLAGDAWGNKITYVVTKGLTDSGTYSGTPNSLALRAGNPYGTWFPLTSPTAGGAAWIAISHGEDMKGAWPLRGTSAVVACGGGWGDTENCMYANNTYYDMFFNDGTGNTGLYFDDFPVWGTKYQ